MTCGLLLIEWIIFVGLGALFGVLGIIGLMQHNMTTVSVGFGGAVVCLLLIQLAARFKIVAWLFGVGLAYLLVKILWGAH